MIYSFYKHDIPAEPDHDEQISHLYDAQEAALARLGNDAAAPFQALISAFLTGRENYVCSPLALLCALLPLSAMCGGAAREELFDAISLPPGCAAALANDLRAAAAGDLGYVKSSISSSLWASHTFPLRPECIREICSAFKTDFYSGAMRSEEVRSAMQAWVTAHTGNFLPASACSMPSAADTVLELLVASHFCARWDAPFYEEENTFAPFHSSEHTTAVCEFMNDTIDTRFYRGEFFTAAEKSFTLDYQMWFVLPNEGVDLQTLAADASAHKFLSAPAGVPSRTCCVTMHIPKFDIAGRTDLKSGLQTLGIRSVFEETQADFSPISADPRLYISRASHTARLCIDEEGAEAASVTDFGIACGCIPPELECVDFNLNRPFFFVLTKGDCIPLYVGAVIDPLKTA